MKFLEDKLKVLKFNYQVNHFLELNLDVFQNFSLNVVYKISKFAWFFFKKNLEFFLKDENACFVFNFLPILFSTK